MIVIPFMFDQNEVRSKIFICAALFFIKKIIYFNFQQNMNKIKRLQMGENLDFYTLSLDSIRSTLRKVLENSEYTMNAKRVSAAVFDQHEKPLDRAIWWIEWVLRHPNENYLQSPVIKLGYMVGNSIDVIGFSAIIFIMQIYISYKLIIVFVYKANILQRIFSGKKRCDIVDIHKKIQ